MPNPKVDAREVVGVGGSIQTSHQGPTINRPTESAALKRLDEWHPPKPPKKPKTPKQK